MPPRKKTSSSAAKAAKQNHVTNENTSDSPIPCMLSQLSSADGAFASLLGPSVTPQRFFSHYWERQPLHVQREKQLGNVGRSYYEGLFTKSSFDEHVRQHASEMSYRYNLNLCVCSKEGRKIDMNPRLNEAHTQATYRGGSGDSGKHGIATRMVAGAKRKQHDSSVEEDGETETMTIAEALKLAEKQKQQLQRGKPKQSENEPEDEEEQSEEDDEDEEHDDDEEDDEPDDEDEATSDPSYAPVTFADYDRLYRSGCTVQALQPQQYNHSMWRLTSLLEEYFGCLVGSNCYITPPNSQGLAPHHDDVDVYILQLEGQKAWKLYEPKMTLPREHSGDFDRRELDEPMMEVELNPGDLLYMPRGIIHEARTSSAMSSHMTISVYQRFSYYDFLSTLFPLALNDAFHSVETEAFRKGLPMRMLDVLGSAHQWAEENETATSSSPSNRSSHTPLSSSAFLGQSRAQLRSSFRNTIRNLCKQLLRHLEENVDAAADVMSQDLMQHRIPPPSSTSNADEEGDEKMEDEHEVDLTPDTHIRIRNPSAIRMIVVPADASGEGEDDEGMDDDSPSDGHILLHHSLFNSRRHHLDGRFPPVPPEASTLQLPLYYAATCFQLLHGNMTRGHERSFVSIKDLPLQLEGMLDSEGNPVDNDEDAKMDARMELALTLQQCGLIETEEEVEMRRDSVDDHVTNIKQNKSKSRPGVDMATKTGSTSSLSSAAAAVLPVSASTTSTPSSRKRKSVAAPAIDPTAELKPSASPSNSTPLSSFLMTALSSPISTPIPMAKKARRMSQQQRDALKERQRMEAKHKLEQTMEEVYSKVTFSSRKKKTDKPKGKRKQ